VQKEKNAKKPKKDFIKENMQNLKKMREKPEKVDQKYLK
jgi:hypothetical protein